MSKLKTLKDLIKENDDELTFGGYTEDVLKQEAIKWIKAKDFKHPSLDGTGDKIRDDAVISWIKYFFNIKKSDLK